VPYARLYFHMTQWMTIPIGQMVTDAQITAQTAGQQLQNDVLQIETFNAPIRDLNRKSRQVLADTAGVDLGDDPAAWDRWTTNLFGRLVPISQVSTEIPTETEEVTSLDRPQAIPSVVQTSSIFFVRMMSCFAAGTAVRTIDGLRTIESIRPGDLVLSQDEKTGTISYNPVVNVFHNPPKETLKLSFEGSDETILPTDIHRFWKAGHGWVMARDLKPGDTLRTVGGSVVVQSIEPDRTQPVFNLRVANARDYFVGGLSVLAHDNSLPEPVAMPFDRVETRDKLADRH
jgi:hypothetical protein